MVFFLFFYFSVNLTRALSTLLTFQRINFWLHWVFSIFLFLISLISSLTIIIPCLLLSLRFSYHFFPNFLRYKYRQLIWNLSSFRIEAFKLESPSKHCFSYISQILICFYLIKNIFLVSLVTSFIYILFKFFNFQIFRDPSKYLLLISSLIQLSSENIFCMI